MSGDVGDASVADLVSVGDESATPQPKEIEQTRLITVEMVYPEPGEHTATLARHIDADVPDRTGSHD